MSTPIAAAKPNPWRWIWWLPLALAASSAAASTHEIVADGIEIHLGLMAAESLRGYPRDSVEARMHGGVPKGDGYYHANVSLFDATTHAPIADVRVEAEMNQAGFAPVTKPLELMRVNGSVSYGNYFRAIGRSPYEFTVRIRKPGAIHTTEVKFRPQPD